MNKDLMMKAAVQFKGVWPEKEDYNYLAVCIKDTLSDESGDISIVHHSCVREYWEIFCTREQFEAFVESLFERAPSNATHVDSENTGIYYRCEGSEDDLISQMNDQELIKFDKLIPRPAKAEPEAPYIPKVGEECEVSVDDGVRWYRFVKTDKRNLILDESWGEISEGLYPVFRPIPTEREIFIKQATEDYLDQVGANAVNKKWFGRIFGAMYDAGYTKGEEK